MSVLLAIVALAYGLRLWHLNYHDLRGDEAFSVFFAQDGWLAILDNSRRGEPHPPLYYFLLKPWMALAGESEFAVRWLSAAAGTALVPLAFAFFRRLGAPGAGIIAAALVAANPNQVWYAQDARMYPLATALGAGVVIFGLRVAGIGGAPKSRDAWGLAAVTLLALYTHYVAATIVAIVHGAILLRWLLWRRPDANAMRAWACGVGAVACLYLPWLVLALPVLVSSYGGNAASPDLAPAVREVLNAFAAGELARPAAAGPLAAAMALAAALGAGVLFRRQPAAAAIIVAILLLPLIAMFGVSRARAVFSARYLVIAAPAFYLLVAQGLAVGGRYALERKWQRGNVPLLIAWPAVGVLATAIVTLTGFILYDYYRDRGGQGRGNWSAFAGYVVRAVAPEDVVVVNHLDPAFGYYYRRLGGTAPTALQPARPVAGEADLDEDMRGLMTPGRKLWLVPDGMRAWDKAGAVAAWLERHAVRQDAARVNGMEVVRYRAPVAGGPAVIFGGSIRLEGHEVRGGGAALRPGESATVDLLWRAIAPLAKDYAVSLQLLDAGGALAAQQDGPPAAGRAPTSTWRTSEVVIDARSLRLPERPGSYTLAVALYELPSVQRLPVAGSPDGLAVLQVVQVGN